MNATLPSLRNDILSSLSTWRHHPSKPEHPLTPPMTSTFHTRSPIQPQPKYSTRMTLPPIAQLERHLSAMPPLTPPDEVPPSSSRLPPILDSKPSIPEDAPHLVDWLDVSRTQSAHFIAEKTCEMICYLCSSTSTLQLIATPTFVQFMQKLLETTQVSQSVIVLSLHYIYRLKERNRFTPAQSGSEFRIAVAALMMANKFLDDNTYTNKTWSEVSGIDLDEINRMEREFLMGVDFNLYVDKSTYESWLNLLKGLVMAKERDSRQFRRSRGLVRSSRLTNAHASAGPSSRPRSTSPPCRSTTYSYPPSAISHASSANPEVSSPTPTRSGSKRSAAAAFSPTTATFSQIPYKRPAAISLQIPEVGPNITGPHSHSPLESLQSFAKMSLASPHAPRPSSHSSHRPATNWTAGPTRNIVPETLVTPYSLDEDRRTAVPQNLYFYSLAYNRTRKARLRYHQPQPPSAPYVPQPPPVTVVQSASTSPHDLHINVTSHGLPHFHDNVWARPPVASSYSYNPPAPQPLQQPHPQRQQQQQPSMPGYSPQGFSESPVPAAPFANAGPPGVHFYPTPVQTSSSVYPHNWSRSRRY
ncbi:cyclin-domain-containing protein [Cyathus striatus]|nr:cyclin-domain-containing protein [Cyathus striatus]